MRLIALSSVIGWSNCLTVFRLSWWW